MSHTATPLTPQDESRLIALFNAGRHAEVEALAQTLVRRHPQAAFAWKALGTAQLLQNKNCVEALGQAVALQPQDAETLCNLGNAHKARGQVQQAEASYRQALHWRPGHAAGHYNLAILLAEQNRLDEAEAAYRQTLQLQPGMADAHNNLGQVLERLGRHSEATDAYAAAVAAHPAHAEAWCNLGAALGQQGRLTEAQAALRQALTLNPRYPQAHHNLGIALKQAHQHDAACESLKTAAKLKADYVDPRHALGDLLRTLRRYDEAILMLKRVIALAPKHADAWIDLGNVHKDLGELADAADCYRQALAIDPAHEHAHSCLQMVSNYMPGINAARLREQALAYGAFVDARARTFTAWRSDLDPERPLRVGLVSGDLYGHPVGYFLESVLSALHEQAGGRLQLTAYATQPFRDALTDRLAACTSHWHMVFGMSDEALAQRIHADGIDILIDLAGHTAHNRLPVFAWKPAPVQVTWLGYFATTGVAQIDHLLADPWTVPDELTSGFTEHVWRLPETRLCFTPPAAAVPVSPLPALRNGHITFGCFNNLTKLNDDVIALWARVLQAVPGSKLLLKASQLDSTMVRQKTQARFKAQGVASDRLVLQGPSTRDNYLQAYEQIDIALDPFPFTGGTTSAEGLWMGVPVLTLAGDSMVARQGVSLLMNAGLPDWVAHDPEDYVAKAAAHASDPTTLATLRACLREQVMRSPLFDAARFARHLETAVRDMWRAHALAQH